MAEPGNVGKLNVEIGGNVAPLKAALKDAEVSAKQAAASIGESATKANESLGGIGKGGQLDGAVKGFKDATAGARNFFNVISAGVGMLMRFLGIIGLVTAALVGAATGLKALWEWLVKVEEGANTAGLALADPFLKQMERLQKAGITPVINFGQLVKDTERLKTLVEELDKIRSKDQNSLDTPEHRERQAQIKALEAEEKIILDRRRQAIERAEQAEAEKAAAEEQEAITKRTIEAERKARDDKRKFDKDQREYNAETERIIREETKRRLDEQEKQQKAAGEEMRKMAREYAAELTRAFQSANEQNRAASDAMMERMATSVNRLKEIAESNRQAQNRGDTSTAGGVW